RILLNLVSNAIRYTVKGGVTVGCRRRGNGLRIEVWDTGIGIPEDQRGSIFREFYQLPTAERDRSGGLGLGLAIVDRLGRLLDHPIEFSVRLGRGWGFAFGVAMVPPRRLIAHPPEAVTDRTMGKLVLVIDDDALVLDSM